MASAARYEPNPSKTQSKQNNNHNNPNKRHKANNNFVNNSEQKPMVNSMIKSDKRPCDARMKRIPTVWVLSGPTIPIEYDFIIGEKVGEAGQFGQAHLCARRRDGATYVVKEISKARLYRMDREQKKRNVLLRRMQQEIEIMHRLCHKYIVNLNCVYEDKHVLWIVMEECKGGELFDRIHKQGRFNDSDAAPIIKMVCEALLYMHEHHRVVHCDLKPDNILFVNSSKNSNIKIIDFGMSQVLPRLQTLSALCGTPYYTAPEVINGQYAHAADMWSVGVILFTMIFGFPPFMVNPKQNFGVQEQRKIYKKIQKGFTNKVLPGFGPWFPQALPISSEARDFIGKLLDMDEGCRLVAKEALQHPWILNNIPQNLNNDNKKSQNENQRTGSANNEDEKEIVSNSSENLINKGIVSEFANFTQSQGFKYAVSALFREQFAQMRPSHFNCLKDFFQKLDTDGNGTVSLKEFENGMLNLEAMKLNKEEIHAFFKELDMKNGGEIAFEEFLNAAVHDYLVANDQRLYQVFRELDTDSDGKITMSEMEFKLRDLNLYDESQVNEMLKVLKATDLNGDGVIDYEEFLRALHPDFIEPPKWFWEVKKTIHGGCTDEKIKTLKDINDINVAVDDKYSTAKNGRTRRRSNARVEFSG